MLYATGGAVSWSASVTGDPGGAIGLSPSSGTLTASGAITMVTVTASAFVPCLSAHYPTITINPGGVQFIVCTGFIPPGSGHGHGHGHGHDDPIGPVAATATAPGPSRPRRPRDR